MLRLERLVTELLGSGVLCTVTLPPSTALYVVDTDREHTELALEFGPPHSSRLRSVLRGSRPFRPAVSLSILRQLLLPMGGLLGDGGSRRGEPPHRLCLFPPTHKPLVVPAGMAVQDQGHPSVSYTTPSSRGAASSGYNVFACPSLSSTSSLAAQQFSRLCLQFPKLHFLIFQYLCLSLFA